MRRAPDFHSALASDIVAIGSGVNIAMRSRHPTLASDCKWLPVRFLYNGRSMYMLSSKVPFMGGLKISLDI